jgi:hypothetical protein
VVCDSDRFLFFPERRLHTESAAVTPESQDFPYPIAESLLLERVLRGIWNHMFRKSYCVSCGILKGFPTEQCVTQEPQVFLPLAFGGKQPHYIRKPLYRYIKRDNSISTSRKDYNDNLRYASSRNELTITMLKHAIEKEPRLSVILQAGNLIRLHNILWPFEEYNEQKAIKEFVGLINQSSSNCQLDMEKALFYSFKLLARFFSNRTIGYKPRRDIKRKHGGRVIAYAAFGIAAKSLLNALLHSGIRPDVFWDIAAKSGDNIDGIPVTPPDFDSLQENDIVLILLIKATIAKDVGKRLACKLPGGNLYYYYDIMDHLAEYLYGDGTCSEVVEP